MFQFNLIGIKKHPKLIMNCLEEFPTVLDDLRYPAKQVLSASINKKYVQLHI